MNYKDFITLMKKQEPECYRGLSYAQRKHLGSKASGVFVEHHHINPRSAEGETDNSSANLISLIPSDHIKAHILLYNEDKTNMKNARTVSLMSKHFDNLDAIEEFKELINNFKSDVYKNKLSGVYKKNKIKEWNTKASKKYYENNKEEINKRRRLLYTKNAETMNEKQRLEYAENIEAKREAVKQRVRKHRQKLKEQRQ